MLGKSHRWNESRQGRKTIHSSFVPQNGTLIILASADPALKRWASFNNRHLFLIIWHFRQNRRRHSFLFLFLFSWIGWLASRVNQARGDKNDQVAFNVLIDIGAEQSTEERDIT